MYYLLALIQSVLAALNMVAWQKLLEKRTIGNDWQTALSRWLHIFMLAAVGYFGVFSPSFEAFSVNPVLYGGLFVALLGILYLTYPLRRTAYLNEKISVLQPFALMRQVFSVLLAVAILSENVSAITLVATLLAVGILVFANMENRRLVLNRYSGILLMSSFLQSITLTIAVKLASVFGPLNYYFVESFGILAIAVTLIVARSTWNEIFAATRKYLSMQAFVNTVSLVSIGISMTLYAQIGVTMTSLLSLLHLVFLIVLGILFLNDVPTKKNVITTALIASCVAVGVFFKHSA